MKEFIKICKNDGALGGWICTVVVITLLVSSFILPPLGIIDSSVLYGCAEIFAFALLFKLPNMINSIRDGKSVKFQKGDTSVEINSEKDDK